MKIADDNFTDEWILWVQAIVFWQCLSTFSGELTLVDIQDLNILAYLGGLLFLIFSYLIFFSLKK